MRRTSLVTRLLAITAVAAVATFVPSDPARADSVESAQARVDSLQQLAKDTTAKLTAGTATWEADQKRLRLTTVELGNTRRTIAAAQQVASEEQRKVDQVARQLYSRPSAGALQMAFSVGPDEVLSALQARQGLDIASGSQAQVIARATTAALRLRTEERRAEQLVDEATTLTKRSADRLRELNALADRTSAQLTEADDALTRALNARARAARLRAEAKARAARSRVVVFSGGATCTGRSTSGQANGNLDPASLCPLWEAPGHRLRSDAAAAFNAMSKYHASTVGTPLCVTDSYRSYSEQVDLYHRKPGLAAVPGSSNHGWGQAVDFCGGVQDSGSAAYDWMKANAGRFGWHHPSWAEPGSSRPEAWHWEFGTNG